MRPRRAAGFLCLAIVLFAQACLSAPPAVSPSRAASPTAMPSPFPATATPTRGAAVTAQRPATPVAAATPTEPRLGIDPPAAASPVRTPPFASPVVRGQEATIGQVQGEGARSPFVSRTMQVSGVVTADFQAGPARGFFMQEPLSSTAGGVVPRPAGPRSTGIFVSQGERATADVKVGDLVTAIGVARETNGRTELDISLAASGVTVRSSGNPLPPPVELQAQPDAAQAARYYESLEGMLVSLPHSLVVGPTTRFGEFTVVRADSGLTRVFEGDPRGAGARMTVDDEGGPDARYDLTVGDQVDGIVGPLDYTFGQYKVQQLPETRLLVAPTERSLPSFAPPGANEFTVASFNLENLFDPVDTPDKLDPCDRDRSGNPCRERVTQADYSRKLAKSALAIRDALGAPTLVAVQEVESIEVLTALAARPELAPFNYGAVLLEGLDPRGIDVGLLYRRDRVTIESVAQRNVCTTANYGFTDAEARCSSRGDGRLDGYFLAARPPLVVTLSVRGAAAPPAPARRLTLIVNHFKAKSGNDPEGKEFVSRRTDEARLVAGIVNEVVAADPGAAVLVLGDLNDVLAAPPLRALTDDAPLRPLALEVPEAERYSYIFNGQSQVLDHILITPNLRGALLQAAFAHVAADYPHSRAHAPTFVRVSDHDPPLARFRVAP